MCKQVLLSSKDKHSCVDRNPRRHVCVYACVSVCVCVWDCVFVYTRASHASNILVYTHSSIQSRTLRLFCLFLKEPLLLHRRRNNLLWFREFCRTIKRVQGGGYLRTHTHMHIEKKPVRRAKHANEIYVCNTHAQNEKV